MPQHIHKVLTGITMQCFEDETQNLVLDTLSDGQTLQSTQDTGDMIIRLHPVGLHHPSCRVLHELQPLGLKETVWEIIKEVVPLGLFQKLSSGGLGRKHFFVLWVEGVLLTTCPRGGGWGGNLSWGSRCI